MKKVVLAAIKGYRKIGFLNSQIAKTLFLTDSVCRFSPTCSEYTYQAVEKYGAIKGSFLGFKRVIRCHPWSKGGFDPIP